MAPARCVRDGVRVVSDILCEICGERLTFQWSDTHGVAVCINCGLPYTIYHYEGEGESRKRVKRPPLVAIKPEWVEIGRKYWAETHRRVFPASYDMGFLRGRECSYSGASLDDCRHFDDWLEQHKDMLPKPESAP